MSTLTHQLPVPATRVVYNKAGMHLAAAVVTDRRLLIDHTLYWATVASADEGAYLAGILNAPVLTELARPLMSYGKDERHIDTHVWKLPIPAYDPDQDVHQEVVGLAGTLAAEIAELEFTSANFVVNRRRVRQHLQASQAGAALNRAVSALMDDLAT